MCKTAFRQINKFYFFLQNNSKQLPSVNKYKQKLIMQNPAIPLNPKP